MGSLKKFKPIWFSCICIYERKALLHTWEPSAARLLKVTPVVYPHLNDFTVFHYSWKGRCGSIGRNHYHWRTIRDPLWLSHRILPYFHPRPSVFSSETPVFSSENPIFLSETPIFSSETPRFSSEIQDFYWRSPDFRWRPQSFHLIPQSFHWRPQDLGCNRKVWSLQWTSWGYSTKIGGLGLRWKLVVSNKNLGFLN